MRATVPAEAWRGTIAGVALSIGCRDRSQLRRVVALMQRFFALGAAGASTAPIIRVELAQRDGNWLPIELGEEVVSTGSLRVWRITQGLAFHVEGGYLDVDITARSAVGMLGSAFWRSSRLVQRGFLLVVLLALLHAARRYGLHASAVERGDGAGLLIVGDPGHGKTTLALSLVRQGWRYVADDAVVLHRPITGRVDAFAVRRSISCGPATATSFPELAAVASADALQADGKLLLDVDAAYPGRSSISCQPRVVIFPEIHHRSQSELRPMDQTTAVIAMLGQMSVAVSSRERAADQLALLRDLVAQADCYRMLVGADVHEDSCRVSAVMERTCDLALRWF